MGAGAIERVSRAIDQQRAAAGEIDRGEIRSHRSQRNIDREMDRVIEVGRVRRSTLADGGQRSVEFGRVVNREISLHQPDIGAAGSIRDEAKTEAAVNLLRRVELQRANRHPSRVLQRQDMV
jgi:hypothetical protein